MARHSRLGEFPGGVLEINAYDDDPVDGHPGVYLEIYHAADDAQRGTEMLYQATAIGYLRTDISGVAQFWDESQIRKLAARLGYDFADMIVYDPKFGRPPLARLKAQATRLDAEAVIVPGPEHFEGGQVPGSLVRQVDVITVTPEETYARRAMPPLPDLPPGKANGA
ncbi:Uncharacterised protein [Nocardia otitidiscaviarum]|uniref:Uncharacterized protein n=1 Tax=Nocardia otitidiscaviarum TaxID=1823 RepID=A0A378YK54_9NOCA|nr:hypothetical protein [Nocardia otitidiscaviarum]SUA76857.1 Uncharacterised protein [Nocardia otitidiscaviarum]